MTDRRFAYGANHFDDTPCPATAAGENPSEMAADSDRGPARVASQYDVYVKLALYDGEIPTCAGSVTHYLEHAAGIPAEGTVDEETARDAWLNATDAQRDIAPDAGERIARKLGWLDD